MLHLYAEPGEAQNVLDTWRESEGSRSWVLSREELIASGLMGPTDPEVAPRIGDVVVAARAGIVYYDDRVADKAPQKMIGQHGSLTPEERQARLASLREWSGMTDEEVIARAARGELSPDPQYALWLVLLNRGDLLG